MSTTNNIRNQHIVPVFYLSNFTTNNKLFKLDKGQEHWRESTPKKICCRENYYDSLPYSNTSIENSLFPLFECKTRDSLKRIIENSFTNEDIDSVTLFMINLFNRSKKIRSLSEDYVKRMLESKGITKETIESDEDAFNDVARLKHARYIFSLDIAGTEICADDLISTIIDADEGEFITSDSPVIIIEESICISGVIKKIPMMVLPLSPNKILVSTISGNESFVDYFINNLKNERKLTITINSWSFDNQVDMIISKTPSKNAYGNPADSIKNEYK